MSPLIFVTDINIRVQSVRPKKSTNRVRIAAPRFILSQNQGSKFVLTPAQNYIGPYILNSGVNLALNLLSNSSINILTVINKLELF